jgi:hypothetical protein
MRPQVEYVLREFDLKIPQQAFEFLFQLYNFVYTVKRTVGHFGPTKHGKLLAEKISRGLQSFTGGITKGTRRQSDQGGDEDG